MGQEHQGQQHKGDTGHRASSIQGTQRDGSTRGDRAQDTRDGSIQGTVALLGDTAQLASGTHGHGRDSTQNTRDFGDDNTWDTRHMGHWIPRTPDTQDT